MPNLHLPESNAMPTRFGSANTLAAASALCFFPLVLIDSAQAASFDCSKATSKVEEIICFDEELSQLDEQLSFAYKQGMTLSKNKAELKLSQRQWLSDKRGNCADAPCIKQAYETRLHDIEQNHGLLLAVGLVTGSWSSFDGYDSLKTIQVGNKVRFELQLLSGPPAYNMGFQEGEFDIQGTTGVFKTDESGQCNISFTFYPTKVVLDSKIISECQFGHGVYAKGTLYLHSKEKPVLTGEWQ